LIFYTTFYFDKSQTLILVEIMLFNSWVFWALFAGTFQSFRNAFAKKATQSLKPLTVTFLKHLFGLPVILMALDGIKKLFYSSFYD